VQPCRAEQGTFVQIVVLGMHRSGTSAVARLLNMMGAYFGPEGSSIGFNSENPKGFWERRDVREVCDALLSAAGSDWWRVSKLDIQALSDRDLDPIRHRFRRVLLELDAHRPWMMKEPRLSVLFPALQGQLEVPVVVFVHRDPLEIARSLEKRNEIPVPAGLALWELYNVRAIEAAASTPNTVVDYNQLVADPVGVVRRLHERLEQLGVRGLQLPREKEVLAFVSPELRRSRVEVGDGAGLLTSPQVGLRDGLRQATELTEVAVQQPLELSTATLTLFEERETYRQQVRELEQDWSQLTEIDRLVHRNEDLGAQVTALQGALAARTSELQALEHGVEQLLRSRRWRWGDLLGRVMEILTFRGRRETVADSMMENIAARRARTTATGGEAPASRRP
jgi:hypothetical protein